MCVNTSSPLASHGVTIEHTVAIMGYTPGPDEKESIEHPSTREEAASEKAKSEDKILDIEKCDNLKDCQALSMFFQKPNCRVMISVGINAGTQRTIASLLNTDAGLNLVQRSFFPPNGRSHVESVKARPITTATKQAVPMQGPISLHVCIEDLHAGAWFDNIENLAVDLILAVHTSTSVSLAFPR